MALIRKGDWAREEPVFFTPPPKFGRYDALWGGGGSAPTPPDPYKTADAQSKANIDAARTQATINRTDSVTPFGTTTWKQDPSTTTFNQDGYDKAMADWQAKNQAYQSQSQTPFGGRTVGMGDGGWDGGNAVVNSAVVNPGAAPTREQFTSTTPSDHWTQTVSLDPKVQGLLSQFYTAANAQLPTVDLTKLPGVSSADLSGIQLPDLQALRSQAASGFANNSGDIARSQGLASNAGGVLDQLLTQAKGTYSKPLDYSSLGDLPQADEAARQKIQDALYGNYSRTLDPQWKQQQSDMLSSLAAQGINVGTDAFDRSYGNFSRAKNDAYDQARNDSVASSTDQMQKLFSMAMARRQQGVGELNTLYEEPMKLATQAGGLYSGLESTLNQDYGTQIGQQQAEQAIASQRAADALGQAGFSADKIIQQHTMTSADRLNQLNAQLAAHSTAVSDRNNILNQLTALATGSQVGNPGAQVQVGAAPVAQSIYNSYQGQLSNYNAGVQSDNALLGAGSSLGGAAIIAF